MVGFSSCFNSLRVSARRRSLFSFAAIGLVLLASGCGSDDEKTTSSGGSAATPTGATTGTERATTTHPTTYDRTLSAPPETNKPKSPEDQPGGAGDEVPASSQALVTGKGGKVSPARIQVPPFIAVKLVLRSADGATYQLDGGKVHVAAGPATAANTATIPGLKTGERLVLKGPQGTVVIEANAEPGP
jgi:hypothetical protein